MLGFHRVKFEVRKHFTREGAYFTGVLDVRKITIKFSSPAGIPSGLIQAQESLCSCQRHSCGRRNLPKACLWHLWEERSTRPKGGGGV